MDDIDFMTCSADDVIARSLRLHPSLYAEALFAAANTHTQAAALMVHDATAREVAKRCAADCHNVALAVGPPQAPLLTAWINLGTLSFGERIQAFTVACRLQCINFALAKAIIGRT